MRKKRQTFKGKQATEQAPRPAPFEDEAWLISDEEAERYFAQKAEPSAETRTAMAAARPHLMQRIMYSAAPNATCRSAHKTDTFQSLLGVSNKFIDCVLHQTYKANTSPAWSRRAFCARFPGLIAALCSWDSAPISGFLSARTQGIRTSHLKTTPEEIAETFFKAPSGELLSYYQLFFPTFLMNVGKSNWDDDLSKIEAIKNCCQARQELKTKSGNWWRLRALPAVAASHVLPYTTSHTANELQQLVAHVFRTSAADWEHEHDAVEIICQNLTASLLQDKCGWNLFSVEPILIQELCTLCIAFITGSDHETKLMGAATAGWQFVLTYERALLSRQDVTSALAVRQMMNQVKQARGERLAWLLQLENLYEEWTRYDCMPPHTSENVIRRPSLSDPKAKRIADYFVMVQLQEAYDNHLRLEGRLKSAPSDERRILEQEKRIIGFCRNYGLTLDVLNEIERTELALLSPKALAHSKRVLLANDPDFSLEAAERESAVMWRQRISSVSLTKLGELNVVAEAFKDRKWVEQSQKLYKAAGTDTRNRLAAVCLPGAAYAAALTGADTTTAELEQIIQGKIGNCEAYQKGLEHAEEVANELS
jgi:hypothetical protein